MAQNIHIGTSGWSYKHWKGNFYPENIKQAHWLAYYSRHFGATEINTSFYHLPLKQTVVNWMKQVPASFLFCPKISRYLTHMKKLREPEETLERFFDVFEPMADQMGPVLVQLPPLVKFNSGVSDHLFGVLQRQYNRYDFVLEVRHPTWLEQDSLDLLARYNIGLVIAQSGNRFPYAERITAKNIYVRFHGPAELYASSYSDEDLLYFAHKFKGWTGEGHEVWAFFNNDIHGFAPQDARRLEHICNNR